ncbi:MAG: rhodanese-like domain-containing protein [Tannerella sp.]|jgi:rhodanese-related sulfurtransferase|nr:rhodanese-like domain-containing protein [Tannerella sp.]
MKKIILAPCLLLLFFCCKQKQMIESRSPAAFEKLLRENVSVQLVDVRRPDEYAAGHLNGAIPINVEDADFIAKADSLLDKNLPVAVYCRSGVRSKKAAQQLARKGYKVCDLESGYIGWIEYIKGSDENVKRKENNK